VITEEQTVYFEIADELPAEWKSGSKLQSALEKQLAEDQVKAEISWEPSPLPGEKKELVMAIIAIGATSVMVAHAIKKVLDRIKPKDQFVAFEKEMSPALDGHGNVVRDAQGEPVMKVTEKPVLLQSEAAADEISVKAFHFFEFRSSNGPRTGHGKTT
jgi:hypothetical protein